MKHGPREMFKGEDEDIRLKSCPFAFIESEAVYNGERRRRGRR